MRRRSHGRAQPPHRRHRGSRFRRPHPTWSLLGETNDFVVRTVTVLVIACPHALGLAIPLVISLSTSISAKAGILVKDRMALERMRTIDTVLFDKTGTLTAGNHVVTGVAAADTSSDGEVLAARRRRGG